jgi:hypothetical protein
VREKLFFARACEKTTVDWFNSKMEQRFENYLRGLKAESATAYRKQVQTYFDFCGQENFDKNDVLSVEKYLIYLHEGDYYWVSRQLEKIKLPRFLN